MKGFLFIPEMAVATLRDVDPKSQTRRVMNPQPVLATFGGANTPMWRVQYPGTTNHCFFSPNMPANAVRELCDYAVGDRRCLLTTWAVSSSYDEYSPIVAGDLIVDSVGINPRGDKRIWHAGMGTPKPGWAGKSRPGRFLPNHLRPLMPVFEVVGVRAERVKDMTEDDAKAEGVTLIDGNPRRSDGLDHYSEFASLWDHINFRRGFGWAVNPWVWVVTFKRVAAATPALKSA